MESISLNSFVVLEHLVMLLTSKLRNFLNKAICIINLAKPFLNFKDDILIWYLNSKWDLNLLSEPEFYGDLVYKLKKIVGPNNFSAQFIKIISNYKKIGYNFDIQTACLVVNPITVGNFAFPFNCMRLFIAALWSPAGKGLTSWLLSVMVNCVFVTFPCGTSCQVWYLIVSIPDLCRLSYFKKMWECGCSVVECLTGDRGAAGSSLIPITVLCP